MVDTGDLKFPGLTAVWVRVPPWAPLEKSREKGILVLFLVPPLAQLVEQIPLKDKVVGSIPTGRTILCEYCMICRCDDAGVAKW